MIVSFFKNLFIIEASFVVLFTIWSVIKKLIQKPKQTNCNSYITTYTSFSDDVADNENIIFFYLFFCFSTFFLTNIFIIKPLAMDTSIILLCNSINLICILIRAIISNNMGFIPAAICIVFSAFISQPDIEGMAIQFISIALLASICYNYGKE